MDGRSEADTDLAELLEATERARLRPLVEADILDVSVAREQAEARLAAAVAAGARVVDDSGAPAPGSWRIDPALRSASLPGPMEPRLRKDESD